MLEIHALHKSYETPQGPLSVLNGVKLRLDAGESLALTGDSGSGKSTLLHLIAGLDSPDSGRIRFDGTEVSALGDGARAALRRSRLGIVFQQYNLIPSLTVSANLAFQARLAERLDPAWQAELIGRLGLDDVLERYPEQISGGQQQRVAIGRALAVRPALLLADEPTGNLDETSSERVMDLACDLVARSGAALLLVTHSLKLAARADAHATLAGGQIA